MKTESRQQTNHRDWRSEFRVGSAEVEATGSGQQLNRHHARKQFDLLRKIAKEGKNYEPFQQPDSNREPKPRLQSVPNGFSDVQIFDPAQLFTPNLIRR